MIKEMVGGAFCAVILTGVCIVRRHLLTDVVPDDYWKGAAKMLAVLCLAMLVAEIAKMV